MSDYDKLKALFDGSVLSLGKAIGQPEGAEFDRSWQIYLDDRDRDLRELLASPADFACYINDMTDLETKVLFSNPLSDEPDAQAISMLVGVVDKDPARTWAIYVDVTLPYESDLSVSAYFSVFESTSRIVSLIEQQTAHAKISAAQAINSAVEHYSQGDPARVCELLDHLRSTGGSSTHWLSQWEAHLMGDQLDKATPATSKAPRGTRM